MTAYWVNRYDYLAIILMVTVIATTRRIPSSTHMNIIPILYPVFAWLSGKREPLRGVGPGSSYCFSFLIR